MRARRELLGALALCVLGAVLLLSSAPRAWVTVSYERGAHLPRVAVSATGAAVAPVQAAALVALAGVLAVVATRGWARLVVGAVLLADALTVAALVWRFRVRLADGLPIGGPDGAVARAGALGTSTSSWPWLALAGAVLLAAGAAAVLVRGRSWPGMSGRYERADARRPRGTAEQRMWDALDQGHDPTT